MKIIFLCHGNICRSPMAEYIFKDLVKKYNLDDRFEIISRGTSNEEYLNDIYPKAKEVLIKNGISFNRHQARKITKAEYDDARYILAMEEYNIHNLERLFNVDRSKVLLLRTFSCGDKEISDPWYNDQFDKSFDEIYEGCRDFLDFIVQIYFK